MTHAYFHAESAAAALARMLPPILKAGGSTLLAVLPMAFSQSYVIRLFFAMSLMIISLGLFVGLLVVPARAGQESEIPNFKGSFLGRFPLVSADFWTSDHLSERSRSVNAFTGTRARGTLTLKRR